MHPPGGVARIVKVVNDRKWQSIPIRKPFDGQSSLLRYQVDERRVRWSCALRLRSAANNAGLSLIPIAV